MEKRKMRFLKIFKENTENGGVENTLFVLHLEIQQNLDLKERFSKASDISKDNFL